MSFTKLSALGMRARINSAYNHLRHLVVGRTKELDERLINFLDKDTDKSNFLMYFGIEPDKYIRDLNEKKSLIKRGDYDKAELEKHLNDRLRELDCLRWLGERESIL